MGGRGQSYTVENKLKNYKNAIFPRNKFKNYLLNPSKSNGKDKFFKELGYNMSNYERLEADIKKKLATNKALNYGKNKHGDISYQVNMQLGINKKQMVTTAWVVEKGSNKPRFVTAYKNESKYFKG